MLDKLNEQQKNGVVHTNGPILVLAGAGTGKTTVITNRIAHIVHNELASLNQILAVTFTNKAANEMRERIEKMVSIEQSFDSWIGTFHSISLKILRLYHQFAGLKQGFTIADSTDQKQVIKKTIERLGLSEKSAPIKLVSYNISKLKDNGVDCHDFAEIAKYNQGDIDMTKIYPEYQNTLRQSNMVDFDDLLMMVIEIFRKNPDILSQFQERFKYVLVDEYQDTNKTQYNLISMLVDKHKNICCVGDDDQSIYSWRGADISNILNFQKYFKDAKVVTLNQNYRSTQGILDYAEAIISQNTKRYEKKLMANIADNRRVKVIDLYDDRQEAQEVASIAKDLIYDGEVNSRNDIAVLVRTTAQMRSIEEAFIRSGIPYKIVGGVKFYERKEIKDAIAYIKLTISDTDLISFERIINTPKRGIGDKTLDSIISFASINNLGTVRALEVMSSEKLLSAKISSAVNDMTAAIKKARLDLSSGTLPLAHVCLTLLEDVGYMEMMRQELQTDPSYEKKLDNVDDLINNISRFSSLPEFFDHISLVSDSDNIDSSDVVNIMTIHASKGLEFDAVILPGWEEEMFPNRRVIEEGGNKGLEEERRLAYVAVTRAKRRLFILNAATRFMFGKFSPCMKSRFILDVDADLYDKLNKTGRSSLGADSGKFSRSPNNHFRQNNFEQRFPAKHNPSEQFSQHRVIPAKHTNRALEKGTTQIKPTSGGRVTHEKYGAGEIIKQLGKFVEVKFESGQRMVMDMSFLIKL